MKIHYGDWQQASTVPVKKEAGATYGSVQDFINNIESSGFISGGVVTDNTDGTVASAAGKGYIRTDSSDISELRAFDFAADTSITLTDNAMNYIYVDYNSGSPIVVATVNVVALNHTSQFVISLVYREGTDVHIASAGQKLNNFIHKSYFYSWEFDGIQRASGIVTSETGTRNIAITAGVFYWALERIPTASVDTSGTDTFKYYYRDGGGGWTITGTQTQVDNTQYDDGDGTLGTLTTNRYGVHWVYMVTDGEVYMIYGRGDYVLAQAEAATAPSDLPGELTAIGVLIAKIIIRKDASSFTKITIPWVSTVGLSGATDHGGLAGLADDDHPGHLWLTGRSGGQTLIGGTDNGDDLTFQTTSDASKGDYIFPEMTLAGFLKNDVNGVVTGGNPVDISDDTNLAVTAPIILTDDTVSIQDAAADDSTKGAATFEADDFDDASGKIDLATSVTKASTTDSGTATPTAHDLGIVGGEGIDTSGSGAQVTIAGEDASDTNKGIASFDAASFNNSGGDIRSKNRVAAITVEEPTGSEDITIFFTPVAITVTEMRAVLLGSATPSVTWTIRHHATDRSNVGNEVVTGGTTTTSTTAGSDVTSFNDATIPADSFVWLETTAKSGTVTELHVSIVFDVDAT